MDPIDRLSPLVDTWLDAHGISGTFAPTRDRREGPDPSSLVWYRIDDGVSLGIEPGTVEAWGLSEGTSERPEGPTTAGEVDGRAVWIAAQTDHDTGPERRTDVAAREPLGPLSGVPLEVTAEIGQTRVALHDLLSVRAGSVLRLDRTVGEPVSLLVNGTVAARGDIVVVGDRLGVRVSEIVAGGGLDR